MRRSGIASTLAFDDGWKVYRREADSWRAVRKDSALVDGRSWAEDAEQKLGWIWIFRFNLVVSLVR